MSCTKGPMKSRKSRALLRKAVEYTVDHLNLKAIVVYSVGKNEDKLKYQFQYAADRGIKIVIPENTLRIRNRLEKRRA